MYLMKENKMKKVVSLLLAVVLITATTITVEAKQGYNLYAKRATQACYEMGLIVGSGDGLTDTYLATTPKRYGGAKLIVGLRGELDKALTYNFTDNFIDYKTLTWTGGQHILGYLKEHPEIGYNGKPGGLFDPNADMGVKEYYKLMLVAAGYVENEDFTWGGTAILPDVMSLAKSIGLDLLTEDMAFTMEKMCVATIEALEATMNGSNKTLGEFLVDKNAIAYDTAKAFGIIAYDYKVDQGDPVDILPEPEPKAVMVTARVTNALESQVVSGVTSIDIIIEGSKFTDAFGGDSEATRKFIEHGIVGNGLATGFNGLPINYLSIDRQSDTTIRINIPANNHYEISKDEEVWFAFPLDAFVDEVIEATSNKITILNEEPAEEEPVVDDQVVEPVDVTVTITAENTKESEVVLGSTKVTVSIDGANFKEHIGTANGRFFLYAFSGSLDVNGSYNHDVRLRAEHVTRNSDSEITIDFPESPEFNIDQDEVITFTLTQDLVDELITSQVTKTYTLINEDPVVDQGNDDSGLIIDHIIYPEVTASTQSQDLTEMSLKHQQNGVTITVSGDEFDEQMGTDQDMTMALLNNIKLFYSQGNVSEPLMTSWFLGAEVIRDSDTQLTIVLSGGDGYNISQDMTAVVELVPQVFKDKDPNKPTVKTSFMILDSGDGTAEKPYLLHKANQLDEINLNSDSHFKLIKDIPCHNKVMAPLGHFTGVLDGDGYSIYGAVIESTGNEGLFLSLTGATIEDLTLSNITISTQGGQNGDVGILASEAYGGSVVENVHVANCSVRGTNRTGGIIGYIGESSSVSIIDSSVKNTAIVSDNSGAGGLVGTAKDVTTLAISNCRVEGVTLTTAYGSGGILDYMSGGSVRLTNNKAEVVAEGNDHVGGILGSSNAGQVLISDCESTGSLWTNKAEGAIGGIMGYGNDTSVYIENCKGMVETYYNPDVYAEVNRIIGKTDGRAPSLADNEGLSTAVQRCNGGVCTAWSSGASSNDGLDISN